MKHYLKNFLFIPCLLVVFLVFLHPTSLVAMDPKVAAEATEEIISGVKNSLVLGDRTGDARVSEGVGKNSGESSVSTAIEGEKDVEEGLKISNEECSDKILAERYGMDQSLESDALLAQENITRLTDQIEEAKHEYKEERNIYFYLWDHIATKLEQSRESWNKVNELIALGNVE
ncbi:MAG TPA: hypothetical protein VJK54_01710, partial [Chthoniobacterales bacterium]|nr:hypothetical protein [Chthoniobacterales bacterium]